MARARFYGTFEYSVDGKGRVAVPVVFRKKLGPDEDTFFFAPGRDRTIEVHPIAEWDEYESRTLHSLPEHSRAAQRFQRFLYASACEARLDTQGRIMLPRHLRELAGIEDSVVIAGAGRSFEIWEPHSFRRFVDEAKVTYDTDRNVAASEGWKGLRGNVVGAQDEIP